MPASGISIGHFTSVPLYRKTIIRDIMQNTELVSALKDATGATRWLRFSDMDIFYSFENRWDDINPPTADETLTKPRIVIYENIQAIDRVSDRRTVELQLLVNASAGLPILHAYTYLCRVLFFGKQEGNIRRQYAITPREGSYQESDSYDGDEIADALKGRVIGRSIMFETLCSGEVVNA